MLAQGVAYDMGFVAIMAISLFGLPVAVLGLVLAGFERCRIVAAIVCSLSAAAGAASIVIAFGLEGFFPRSPWSLEDLAILGFVLVQLYSPLWIGGIGLAVLAYRSVFDRWD